jgi:hypothetical protein
MHNSGERQVPQQCDCEPSASNANRGTLLRW